MKNIFIIIMVIASLGYMVSILLTKYETIKTTNQTIEKRNQNKKKKRHKKR